MQRSARAGAGQRAGVSLAVLEQLRAARLAASGDGGVGAVRRVDQVQLRDEGAVYSEVSEDEYARLVQERRMQGDFVEDDGEDLGYQDDGEENWQEYTGEEDDGRPGHKPKHSISRVARVPAARKRAVAVAPSAPVSGAFLGGGRSVGPSSGAAARLTADDERLMNALLSDLDRNPLRDDEDADEDADAPRKGAALGDVAMFAQPDAFTDALQAAYEADEALLARTTGTGRRLQRALRGAAPSPSPQRPFDVRPPQPIFDLDEVVDLRTAQRSNTAADDFAASHSDTALSTSPPSSPPPSPTATPTAAGPPVDAQRASNLAALSAALPAHKKVRKEAFAFSSARAVQSNAVAARASALPPSGPVQSAAPSATEVFASVLSAAAPSQSIASAAVIASSLSRDCGLSPVSDDSSLLFYYYDAYEDPQHTPGTVYLFGKALVPSLSASASTCLQVSGVQRNVFLLPRKWALLNADDERSVTDSAVTLIDVFNELTALLRDFGVEQFKVKPVRRTYAFDRDLPEDEAEAASLLDPVDGVPREAEYMKLVYPFTARALPRSLKGRTFSRAFGCKSTAMEMLLLKKKLQGPAWLHVTHLDKVDRALSWCRFEYRVSDLKHIQHCRADTCPPQPPLFSLVSLSTKTVRSDKSGRDELVMVSLLHQSAVNVESGNAAADDACSSVETVMAPLHGHQPPTDWPLTLKAHNAKHAKRQVVQCSNERAMLAWLLTRLGNLDPDVLLSHDLHHLTIDLLCSRMQQLKVPHWSKLGRLKRTHFPTGVSGGAGEGGAGASLLDRGVGSGRLMVDTQLMAKEFLLGKRLYTLSYLAEHIAGLPREDIDGAAVPAMYGRSADLLRLAQHTESDTFIALRLSSHMQLLPLTKQLTALAGNTWSRTLRSMRSERVEWLLLHHFHGLKYIIPERYTAAEKRERAQQRSAAQQGRDRQRVRRGEGGAEEEDDVALLNTEEEADGAASAGRGRAVTALSGKKAARKGEAGKGAATPSSRRRGKPLYSGGLVLEPKKGFYDDFVLVLDFNSLYPSIIQEFNLCFTTLPHWRVQQRGTEADGPGETNPVAADDDDGGGGAEAGAADAVVTLSGAALLPLPAADAPAGELPAVLKRLVERRRDVRRLEKDERDAGRKASLYIRQLALKLVANSMYGCLGFTNSRFYCPALAALVTSRGRDILAASVELCASLGANVIYGDTDSLMIDTATQSYEQALALGCSLQREINKRHSVLEIAVDGVFRNMLLLRKKKYAALRIVDDGKGGRTEAREVKGLDLVRRDWCLLSRDVGMLVLNFLLSGKARDDIVELIVLALHDVRARLQANAVHLDKFVITKSLTKAPRDYGDAQSQPHVQVALQLLGRGEKVRAGDIVPYIVCTGEGPIAKRAYHPSTVIAASGALSVDVAWYLSNQVHPPIVRLCGVMEELDSAKIAHALGLDPRHYNKQPMEERPGRHGERDEDDELMALSSVSADSEQRFKDCAPLLVTCAHCHQRVAFKGAIVIADEDSGEQQQQQQQQEQRHERSGDADDVLLLPASITAPPSAPSLSAPSPRAFAWSGFGCPTAGCVGLFADSDDPLAFVASLHCAVLQSYRGALRAYYTAQWQCNDSSCRHSTRDSSAHPRARCLRARCQGRPVLLQPASALYLQLLYLRFLVDVDAQLERVSREERRRAELREAVMAATAARAATARQQQQQQPQQQQAAVAEGAERSAGTGETAPLTTSWLPSPSLSPSELLSKRQMVALRAVHGRVGALLQESHYHFIQPTVFATAAGKRPKQ